MFHVYKIYPNNQVALIDVSLRLDKGDFAYIIGPSGAGKTTILKLILCLERPTKGLVLISGINTATIRKSSVPYLRRNIGVIFQDLKLLTNRTVFENVALALEIIGALQREVQKKVWQVLRLVGLHNKSNLYPPSLSVGEQQRVAIARAMVNDPLILLADEPTGNLDPEITASIMDLMGNINARGTTVVVATHNPHLIRERHGKVFFLENGRVTGG
ncbi:MAG: cell division ATP-binding protein FtsE [Pseudomonadota bacterium]